MANISLRHIYKVYPNGVKAVNDFNMDIEDKEFIVFVGPSGCGKSTTLRMIAGLEDITAGELFIGNHLVNDVSPKDRDIAMVFQNYALYPHMTVYENMAFGLRLRHVPQEEIHRKVMWAADVLKLTEYLDRKPKAMSGGQRQRVSLGRAILRNPKVFLLDEPLSNLDAKLRTEMRAEISKLHKELNTTFIYVTHDQVEAMTMGTRIVVMKLGFVQQIDTPKNLYNHPVNKFVAGFIGTPQMNFFEATLKRVGEDILITFEGSESQLRVPYEDLIKIQPRYLNGDKKVIVGLRSEHISANPDVVKASKNRMKVKVSHFEELGDETLVYGDLDMNGDGFSESNTRVILKHHGESLDIERDQVIEVAFDMKKAHFFDKETEMTIMPLIPSENVFDGSIKKNVLTILKQKITLPSAIKCEDLDNCEVYIPSSALKIDNKGEITATINKIEEINGTKVCYLYANNRCFFTMLEGKHKVGEQVKVKIDFKNISIEHEGKRVVDVLPECDTFLGGFTDATNTKLSLKLLNKNMKGILQKRVDEIHHKQSEELSKIVYQSSIVREYKKDWIKTKNEIQDDCSYQIATQAVGKEGKKKLKAEADKKLAEVKEAYLEKVRQANLMKTQNERLSPEEVAKLNEKVAQIQKHYAELEKTERDNFAAITASYVDASKNMHLDYTSKKEEKNAKYQDDVKSLETKYQADKASYQAEVQQKLEELKAQLAQAQGEEIDRLKLSIDTLTAESKLKLEKLKDDYLTSLDELAFESRCFYGIIDNLAMSSTNEINQKIVKSLGANLFNSTYRYEVHHDAYTLVKEGTGIKAHVDGLLDYGEEKYLVCSSCGRIIYFQCDDEKLIGKDIYLSIDITKTKIFENQFDIRLF